MSYYFVPEPPRDNVIAAIIPTTELSHFLGDECYLLCPWDHPGAKLAVAQVDPNNIDNLDPIVGYVYEGQ